MKVILGVEVVKVIKKKIVVFHTVEILPDHFREVSLGLDRALDQDQGKQCFFSKWKFIGYFVLLSFYLPSLNI